MGKSILKKKAGRTPYETKVIDKNLINAFYFGFNPIKTPQITKNDLSLFRIINDPYSELDHLKTDYPFGPDALEKIAILRSYNDWKLNTLPHPILASFSKPLPGSEHRRGQSSVYGFEIMGLSGSSTEGIMLQTLLSILNDEGYSNLNIRINCLGDKESIADYERAVTGYVRKNIADFPAELRKAVKSDFFEVCRKGTPEKILNGVPKSINFLSEISRIHFKEVLEFIESFSVPYTIDHTLVASPYYCNQTVFEIESVKGDSTEILASGFCYGRLSRKLGIFKKELPVLGATLSIRKKVKSVNISKLPKLQFYLIQLGFPAKLLSLRVIELLRKNKIAVAHSLAKDKLQSQLSSAENMRVPFILIVGQKEAIENSVTVRDVSTRVQETVPIANLISYIKKLKL